MADEKPDIVIREGVTGMRGPEGPPGPQGQIGPVGLNWRGVWDATVDYVTDDAVGHNNASWFADVDPPVGEEPSAASTYWHLLAAQGALGPQGATGPEGPQGVTGPEGPEGAPGFVWRGAWDAALAYETDDAVQYGGSSWIATASVVAGSEPGVAAEWELFAAEGDVGPAGEDAAASTWQSNADGTAIIPVDNSDSWVVGSDRMDRDTGDTSKNKRAFFNKIKGAFRAGTNGGTDWNDLNVGVDSYAVGRDTTASGEGSHAEGWATNASGFQSHAEGGTTNATGDRSHAEGQSTTASGGRAHAEGYGTTASASNGHSEGYSTTASNSAAHAEGSRTTADGAYSHAEGNNTRASGNTSRASGVDAVASRWAQSAHSGGRFVTDGDAQSSLLVISQETADALSTLLSVGASTTPITGNSNENVLTLALNRAHKFRLDVAARRTDVAGEAAGWEFSGLIARDATGDPYFVGNIEGRSWGTVAAAAWDVTLSIDTTTDVNNPFLAITATGEAGKTIRWVASLNVVEVG